MLSTVTSVKGVASPSFPTHAATFTSRSFQLRLSSLEHSLRPILLLFRALNQTLKQKKFLYHYKTWNVGTAASRMQVYDSVEFSEERLA